MLTVLETDLLEALQRLLRVRYSDGVYYSGDHPAARRAVQRALASNAENAALIHYPQHWDTAAYPTLASAIRETLAWAGCSACKEPGAVADDKARAIEKAQRGECEGNCEEHHGETKAVHVWHKDSRIDWGHFSYCAAARKADISLGMEVEDA